MYFKSSIRRNPETQELDAYYRLVESYRNYSGRVCHTTILNIGFLIGISVEQINVIQKVLTNRSLGKVDLFESSINLDSETKKQIDFLWHRIITEKRIDLPELTKEKRKRLIDVDTLKNKDVRELGLEWMSFQALEQLKIGQFLQTLGWSEEKTQLTLTQIISRACYPASELKTTSWIKENSAVCEITHYPIEKITKDKLYQNALDLYEIKDKLEQHLSKRTNELFDLEDKIILYDLTNTYFEGEKRNSKLAKYGRSKEKRSDAKLIVLALVVNQEGFLKYSNIFEGNTSDSSSLPTIIENLRLQTTDTNNKALVVLDAGIATDKNLELIEKNGYNYVCVSRSQLKDYKAVEGTAPQKIATNNKQELTLQSVSSEKSTDYYLKVKSPGKTLKEESMKSSFEMRFEEELQKIQIGLSKKHTVKKTDKINQRIGRAIQKYPSISKYYIVEVKSNDNNIITEINWTKDSEKYKKIESNLGVYFVRTNLKPEDEVTLWKIYNTIREIESSFRTLKTDLDLRPIYHKNDDSTLAHIHLGLLGYWLVNTIRHQLKSKKINYSWKEIVRIANTQKLVTTSGINQDNETIYVRRCSEPNESIKNLYDALNYKSYPFVKRKSVVHKPENKNHKNQQKWESPPN